MIKKSFLIIIILLVFITFISSVKANFACGLVKDGSETKAGWFTVKVFYQDQPTKTTSCKVSPQDNKYCCDLLDIPSTWSINKDINASILDKEKGYFADSVITKTTGEGYTIFPDLYLKKAITLNNPLFNAYYNSSYIIINLSSSNPYNNLYYTIQKEEENLSENIICNNCNETNFLIENLSFGKYKLTIKVNDSLNEFIEQKNVTLLENFSITRDFSCERCNEDFISSKEKNVSVNLKLDLSHTSQGKLKEFIPSDWEIIDANGASIEYYSDTHNVITWEVSGDSIEKQYIISAPETFLTKKYIFKTEFENITAENKYFVYRFFKFSLLSFTKSFSSELKQNTLKATYQEVSKEEPLLLDIKKSYLDSLIIIPNKTISKARLGFVQIDKNNQNFIISSSIPENRIKERILRIKTNESLILKNVYSDKTYLINHTLNQSEIYDLYLDNLGEYILQKNE